MVDSSKIVAFVNALNSKFENKQSNKKTDITGDFSDDTVSYPTVQAVKSWVGTQMSNVGSIILGETSDTAYRGDRGKAAYDHSQITTGNPHNVTKSDIGLSNVTNVAQAASDHVHGQITNDGKITSTAVTVASGDNILITDASDSSKVKRVANLLAGHITDGTAHSNIGSSANATQATINTNIDTALSNKANSSSLSTVATSGSYTDLSDKPDLTTKEDVSNKKASWSGTPTNTNYPTEKLVKDSLDEKVDKVTGKGLSTNDFTNTYKTALDNLSTNLGTKDVTVEKKTTAESGYIASYIVKQNGTQVGSTINIPKDYLVKSASVGTVTTANDPVTGYTIGDKYLDFIINTKDNTGTNEHLYVLVSDLIDTYTAGSGLTLTSNQFSISNGDISLAMLATGVQTSLGYADNWNNSAAKTITSSNITAWNNKSNLTIADVDTEIEAYLTAITTALEPSQP